MTLPTLAHYICFTAGAADFEADDLFTRTDSALVMGDADSGQQWFPAVGTWGLASGKAYCPTLSGGKGLAWLRSLAGGTVSVTLSTHAASCGLAARIQDSTNFWLLRDNTTNYKLELVQAGVATVKDTIAVVPANGDVLTITLEGSTLTAKVNSTTGTPVEDSTFQRQPRAGLYAESTAARFDTFDASFVWTNVTGYVKRFEHERGRQHELDKVETGTAKYRLAFSAREFEPDFQDGMFWPFIVPMRRIKTVATLAGVDTGRFYGFIERWPIVWTQSGVAVESEVEVEAVDPLAVASMSLFDAYPVTVANMHADWHYRLGESDTTATDSGPNGYADAVITNGALSAPGLLPSLSGDNGALTVDNAASDTVVTLPTATAPSGTQDFTVAGMFSFARELDEEIWQVDYAGGHNVFVTTAVSLGSNARGLKFRCTTSGGANEDAQHDSYSITDGAPHLFVAVRDATNSTISLYVDGVLAESMAHTADSITGTTLHELRMNVVSGAAATDYVLDEFSMWDRCLTAEEVETLAIAAGVARSANQTTGDVVNLIADLIGFSPKQRSVDTGQSTMQSISLSEMTPREALDLVEDTEDGFIFCNGDGYLVFQDRYNAYGQITHDTWGDLDDPSEHHYEALIPSYDYDRIFNDIRVERLSSVTAVAVDDDSKNDYGTRTLTRTVAHDTDTETEKQADWLLYRYKEPLLRADGVDVRGWTDAATVLATDLGTRITAKRRPASGGDPMSFETTVCHLHEVWEGMDWWASWQLAPIPNVWILGDPVFGLLGETTVLGW